MSTIIMLSIINVTLLLVMLFLQKNHTASIVSWGLLIILLPFVGFIIYMLYGDGFRFSLMREAMKKRKDDIVNLTFLDETSDFRTKYKFIATKNVIARLNHNQSGAYYFANNTSNIYTSNEKYFEALIKDINHATKSIDIEQYIFKNDDCGYRLRELLIAKAKSGVEIKIIYDGAGSRRASIAFFRPLILSGAKVERFNRKGLSNITLSKSYRNHRNAIIIDGKIAYLGSAGCGNEYKNTDIAKIKTKDICIRIEGEIVNAIKLEFVQDYNFASGKFHSFDLNASVLQKTEKAADMQYIIDGPDKFTGGLKNAYLKAISTAKKSILITTQNFIPDRAIMDALTTAINTGVDVKLLLTKNNKDWYKLYLSYIYSNELVQAGGKVYLYDGYLNSKSLIIDEDYSFISTLGIDKFNFNNTFENAVAIYNPNTAKMLANDITKELKKAIVMQADFVEKLKFFPRLMCRIERLINPLV